MSPKKKTLFIIGLIILILVVISIFIDLRFYWSSYESLYCKNAPCNLFDLPDCINVGIQSLKFNFEYTILKCVIDGSPLLLLEPTEK